MREPAIALLKHSEGLLKGLTDVGTGRSTARAKEPQGRPYLSIPKRHYTPLRGRERRNNGGIRSRERSGTENQRRRTERERRNFGGISEDSRSNLGVISDGERRNNGASIERAYRMDGETTENGGTTSRNGMFFGYRYNHVARFIGQ
jgi:hypothetical protein